MPSRQMADILALIPEDFAHPEADYVAVRSMLAPFHGHPVPDHVVVTETTLDGVRAAWYDAADDRLASRVALHCHGGGFVSCPLDAYHFYGAMLVDQLGLRVVMPDYRLAPEDPYPAALDDCLAVYRGLLETGQDPRRLVVMGDSCGGGLALSMLLVARNEGLPMPACFVSVSGWFDLSVAGPGDGAPDPFLSAGWVRNRGRDYTAGALTLDDPRVSPAYADLTGLPALYLPTAQHDTVRAGTWTLAARAAEAGVAVTAESWPGMVHGWEGLVNAGVPEAAVVWRRTAQFIDATVKAEGPTAR